MSPGDIYAKTEAGLRELKERKLNLSIAQRSVLIMIDGRHTAAEIVERARILKVDAQVLTMLEGEGLIAARGPGRPVQTPATTAGPEPAGAAVADEDSVQRYLQAQRLMSEACNQHLGFRGYGMMMRLQRTASTQDLREILPDLAKALVKRIGVDATTPVVTEIERLLVP